MVSMAVLVTGAMIGLTVVASTSARGEVTKEQALAYKACQDVMEALMCMDKATLLTQMQWQSTHGGSSPFTVTAIRREDGSSPTGGYSVTDISTRSDPAATPQTLLEFRVSFQFQRINVQLTGRRYVP
jgi:hypothetical protein